MEKIKFSTEEEKAVAIEELKAEVATKTEELESAQIALNKTQESLQQTQDAEVVPAQ